jgi:hypothetical protein
MRKVLAPALLCLVLAACATADEIRLQQEQADNAKCTSYGAHVGEPAYVQCRAQLDAARTVADASKPASSASQPIRPANIPTADMPPYHPPQRSGLWHPGQF